MSVVVQEAPLTRHEDAQGAQIGYIAWGSSDRAEIKAAVLTTAPESYAGFPRTNPTIDEITVGVDGLPSIWSVMVPYGGRSRLVIPPTGTIDWSGDTGGGTQHITNSIDFQAAGQDGGTIPEDLAGAIGATKDGVAGIDIIAAAYNFQAVKYVAADAIAAVRAALFAITGTTNNAPWTANGDTFAEGTVLFLGGSYQQRKTISPADWEVTFKFAARQNVDGATLTIGSIDLTGFTVGGWEYLEVVYEDVAGDVAITKNPLYVLIHKVYKPGDFSTLGLT